MGLGVREANGSLWWCFRLRVGTGGGCDLCGVGARLEAKLDATRALASWSPVVRPVVLRGYACLNRAWIDFTDCELDMGPKSDSAVDLRLIGLISTG